MDTITLAYLNEHGNPETAQFEGPGNGYEVMEISPPVIWVWEPGRTFLLPLDRLINLTWKKSKPDD